jgi:hypothetical protein
VLDGVADQRGVPVRGAEMRQDSTRDRLSSWWVSRAGIIDRYCTARTPSVEVFGATPCASRPFQISRSPAFEFGPDHGELGRLSIRPDRVTVVRLEGLPPVEPPEQLGAALEAAEFGTGVVQRDDALDPLRRHAQRGVDIPVQLDVEAGRPWAGSGPGRGS